MIEEAFPDVFGAEFMVLYSFALPLAAAFIAAIVRSPNIRDWVTIVISVALFINIINILSLAPLEQIPSVEIAEIMPNLKIMFFLDSFGMIFALIASFLWIVTTIFAIGYMRGNHEIKQNRFYAFFALSIFSTMGIAFAGNMLTLFIFYEILTLSTYPLVTHSETEEARKSGRIYLGILLSTSILFLLPAIIWTWSIAGTLDFEVGGILSDKVSPTITGVLLFLYIYGIGKAAIMPIHKWLPAAMVAPTPVSALLHAVAVVKAGVFTILKVIVYIFGSNNLSNIINENWWAGGWLPYIAGITIILASVTALRSDNLKRRLAYSTISQLSYIVMAAAVLAPKAIMAAALHIAAHAVGKITLFFAAGSIYTASHKKNVSELNGIGKRMPYTMTAFSIAAISMIGLPPTIGFLSKYYMLLGFFEYGHFFAIAVITISTLLNASYLLPIIYAAFFKEEDKSKKHKDHGEAPAAIVLAITITATMTVLLFAFPNLLLWLGIKPIM